MKKLAFLIPLLIASPAFAHGGHGAEAGLAAGLLHPLTGFDHLAAMMAAGLAASSFRSKFAAGLAAAFLAAMAGGFAVALGGVALPAVEGMILLSVAVIAGLALLPQRYPASLALFAGFALFHGHAHGLETSGDPASFALGFLVTSATLIATGFLAGRLLRRASPVLLPAIR
ncbi:HupE/UreJ family protein [Gellertiella hungarica]|uniref:Urease accessory protein n=1 Tax=Gellertiella hungarica TaxID=1572859 RepID=A0A7W6J266_9HYPH|nr:HupE/UreJ family protein [Gellertiella hungarica]MBB4063357.1 urease accessory protein [Gellertiella hungarica]